MAAPAHVPTAAEMAAIGKELADPTLNEIRIDGLVVLKIVKHCKDKLPETAIGQLVGMENGTALEVTNCFALPPTKSAEPGAEVDEDAAALEAQQYSLDMLRYFRSVNVDCNTVGWYSSASSDSLCIDLDSIAAQCDWQLQRSPRAVMLVFDPLRTTQEGSVALHAYRLKQSFMALYQSNVFTVESLQQAGVSYKDILEEVPLKVTNPSLITAYLHELECDEELAPDFARFDVSVYPHLEKNLEYVVDCLDGLSNEQNKFQLFQRAVARQAAFQKRRAEEGLEDDSAAYKQPQQPRQLETLLYSSQVASLCDSLCHAAGESAVKMFLLGGLKKDESLGAAAAALVNGQQPQQK